MNPTEPRNEPVLQYAPDSKERAGLKSKLRELAAREVEVPLHIGGREVRTGRTAEIRLPHDRRRVLGRFHQGGGKEVLAAIAAAREASKAWALTPPEDRAAIFRRAADLLAGEWRQTLNAATMLGLGKTAFQAEIDAACELTDYWRFNPWFIERMVAEQPFSAPGVVNRMEYRPLEGFVFAVTPFNFTAIAGNLPTAPALMGNTVVWKPASNAVYPAHFIMKIIEAAGLPPGVINMVPGPGAAIGDPVLASPDLAGIHFTGSTSTFRSLWRKVGENIERYRSYPRIVGETGGKGFAFAHPSADPDALVTALVRGAFEYQGQKCSAASRAYVPQSLWPAVEDRLVSAARSIRMGDVSDFRNFMGAVIDRPAFDKISGCIEYAKARKDEAAIIAGGRTDDSVGYFVEPTVIVVRDPQFKTMEEEIFGPVLSIFVYPDAKLHEALALCDTTSPYALTGAVFARDRAAIEKMSAVLRHAAGNFYVNDKPTGAMIGQQPFGGGRASGTNDKAGGMWNLVRWTSMRTTKENLEPPTDYRYPFMREE